MSESSRAGIGVYIGLLLTTLSTLAYQLLLTRIFSVTMWYHYSFMAVSVAMFGMTVGAILVYLRPGWFTVETAARQMGLAGLLFAGLIVATYLIHLQLRLAPRTDGSWGQLAALAANYALLSLPFIASGVCVTIALTRFPRQIGPLYAVDLIGAGLGCLLVVAASQWIDAPRLILDVALLAVFGGLYSLADTRVRRIAATTAMLAAVIAFLGVSAATSPGHDMRFFRPKWIKGQEEPKPEYERWNSISRIAVWGMTRNPVGWGLSKRFVPERPIEQYQVNIDAGAGTIMTGFHGDLRAVDFLRYDVSNMVHYLRPHSRTLVIGVGGGRDILSALVFRQPEIVGVEINDAMLETVNGRYGDFTGHLDRRPEVTFFNEDARSYITQTDGQFDVIQASLLDTFAATAAGAYVLSENSLYTVEAWTRMLERLTDRGVISFSRWYSPGRPGEIYRLTALAVAALRQIGVANPARHLAIVYRPSDSEEDTLTTATLLLSRSPLTTSDLDVLERVIDEMAFESLLSPRGTSDSTLGELVSGGDLDAFTRSYPINIEPPTDDRPFFFDMIRLRNLASFHNPNREYIKLNLFPITTLGALLVTVIVLTGLCVIVPLALTTRRQALRGELPLFLYFGSIGLGFMLVEIALMQRLTLFLGHPIHGMSVVLFCLLTATGCGSWLSGRVVADVTTGSRGIACLAALAVAVLLVALALGPVLGRCDAAPTPARIALVSVSLLLLGLLMGAGFPLGMRLTASRSPALMPWLFGINGAMSICGSVGAVVLSLCLGLRATLLCAAVCYSLSVLWFAWAQRRGNGGMRA